MVLVLVRRYGSGNVEGLRWCASLKLRIKTMNGSIKTHCTNITIK